MQSCSYLQFLSGKEKVVAFFTGRWYQSSPMLKLDEGIGSYLGRSWTSFVLLEARKSADAIVVAGNEPRKETVEASQSNEGLNVRFVHNSIRKLLGLTQSSLILNKDRRLFGAKSEKLIPGEPLYTRPVRTVV